jgi:hypothetical protein
VINPIAHEKLAMLWEAEGEAVPGREDSKHLLVQWAKGRAGKVLRYARAAQARKESQEER